jgi:hypothetical protein
MSSDPTPDPSKYIQAGWEFYETHAGSHASPRHAYFTGAWFLLQLLDGMDEKGYGQEQRNDTIDAIRAEFAAFQATEDFVMKISVGTTVVAKRETGICTEGERGVCYEMYTLDGRPGYSFIFERGGYDGFSPSEVEAMLEVTGHCAEVSTYAFTNVQRLCHDFQAGRFDAAFPA